MDYKNDTFAFIYLFFTNYFSIFFWSILFYLNSDWMFIILSAGDHRVHSNSPLFWLHTADVIHFLDPDWHHWILCGILFHSTDLCSYQDWLSQMLGLKRRKKKELFRLWELIINKILKLWKDETFLRRETITGEPHAIAMDLFW